MTERDMLGRVTAETSFCGMNEIELANIEHSKDRRGHPMRSTKDGSCSSCNKPIRECWCFADDNALNGCRCNIPNAGLPLTGEGVCQVCGKQV